MNNAEIGVLVVIGILLIIAILMIMKRGLTGAILGGEILETYGELNITSHGMVSHRIRILKMLKQNESCIVFEYKQSTLGSFKLTPIRLSKKNAVDLTKLLDIAIADTK